MQAAPTNYEDILFNQLKNAKFVHPVPKQDIKQENEEASGWANFVGGKDETKGISAAAPVNRFDLIHDAFAELVEENTPASKIEIPIPKIDSYITTLIDIVPMA